MTCPLNDNLHPKDSEFSFIDKMTVKLGLSNVNPSENVSQTSRLETLVVDVFDKPLVKFCPCI